MNKLKETIPSEGMIGEVHYWRDLTRILDAVNGECKQNYVEIVVQVLALESEDKPIQKALEQFMKEKSRVIQGTKEARWNHKYMKVIEKPVTVIEQAKELRDIQVSIVVLLKSLKNIYENSNFYKEARIVSFTDRLLACIVKKIREKISINLSVINGKKSYQQYS